MKSRNALPEDGRSIVEFAFACAALFGMLFGIVYFSLALYTYHYISEAAREGSRYAIVRGSTSCVNTPALTNCNATASQIQTYLQDLGYPAIDAANRMTVNTTWYTPSSSGSPPTTTWALCTTAPCNLPGNLVNVQVTYNYPLSIPFYGKRTLNMTSTSQMVIAQ